MFTVITEIILWPSNTNAIVPFTPVSMLEQNEVQQIQGLGYLQILYDADNMS